MYVTCGTRHLVNAQEKVVVVNAAAVIAVLILRLTLYEANG